MPEDLKPYHAKLLEAVAIRRRIVQGRYKAYKQLKASRNAATLPLETTTNFSNFPHKTRNL